MSVVACNSGTSDAHDSHEHSHDEDSDHSHAVESSIAEVVSVYDNSSTTVGFGAFKTTAKKEVKGWFTDFEVSGITESKDLAEILGNASINISVSSLDTKDDGRNATLLAEFFNKTTSNENITGKVVSIDKDNSIALLELTFNDVSKELEFTYNLSGDTLSMQSVLNLKDVNGLEALASISTACDALHKGDDGVSKTWSDVNIYLTTVLNR
ncbi:MAG: polyisoprenoid-binding protein YceI [Glaciecola sp.]|jgi:polyisoprenoid-binding protein YceI